MFHHLSTRISIFCLAFMVGIAIPKISWGIANINLNSDRPSSVLAIDRKTDAILNSTAADKSRCQSRNGEPIYLAQSIICERRLGLYILLRRVYDPDPVYHTNRRCLDQIIDIRTGKILQKNPAPCNRNC